MIFTGEDRTEETKDLDLQEIDDILGEGEAYKRAVSESQRQGLKSSRLQAEPSHFHLAALA